MIIADLHLHSTASDGLLSPSQMINRASELKINLVSLTDHDTTEGIAEAIEAGNQHSVRIIPGVEISTELADEEIHVLGYNFDLQCPRLQQELTRLKQAREGRIRDITLSLVSLGFDISWDEVTAAAGNTSSIGRPHVARVMVQKGYAQSIKDVFTQWIGPGCPAYINRYKLTPDQAIDLIHGAGGKAFLAHPGLLKHDLAVADRLVEMGLDGIEVFHSDHSVEQIDRYLQFVQNQKLYLSGGSDCHGDLEHSLMGKVLVEAELLKPWLKD